MQKQRARFFSQQCLKCYKGAHAQFVFFDDVCVTGTSIDDHINNLNITFEKLSTAGFKLNRAKCEFFRDKVTYLGHVIDKNGLHKDDSKVNAVKNAPEPRNQTEVKAFIGLVNYYARFFPKSGAGTFSDL